MSAQPPLARSAGRSSPNGGLVAAALAAVGAWLVEPADRAAADPLAAVRERLVVAVFGLAPACGATTVARALAVELARRDPAGVAAVGCESRPPGTTLLATRPAARLARSLANTTDAPVRAAGRICLVASADHVALAAAARSQAPLVLDAAGPEPAPAAAALADAVVLVVRPGVEPSLVTVVAAALARIGPEPLVVVNRAGYGNAWDGDAAAALPEARAAARLALAGREPGRAFGRSVAALADRLV